MAIKPTYESGVPTVRLSLLLRRVTRAASVVCFSESEPLMCVLPHTIWLLASLSAKAREDAEQRESWAPECEASFMTQASSSSNDGIEGAHFFSAGFGWRGVTSKHRGRRAEQRAFGFTPALGLSGSPDFSTFSARPVRRVESEARALG